MGIQDSVAKGVQERAAKKAERFLDPGERVLAACNTQRNGAVAGRRVGGVAGTVIATQTGKAKIAEAKAGGFPVAAQMTIAVTDRRLIMFFGKRFIGTVDRDQIVGAEIVKKPRIWPPTIRILARNGHETRLTCNRGVEGFVAAVQELADSDR